MTTLFNHQRDFLHKPDNDKSSLIWSCGTGKTRTAIEWANLGDTDPLIICPKALKTNWQREVEKWGERFIDPVILTKEEFRKQYKTLEPVSQIIVDEVHNGFLTPLFKSQMSKALKWYLKKHDVPRVLLLSATPYTSSPWNIFNLAHYTGHEWNYRKFSDEFFYQVRMGPRMIPMVKKGSEKKLARLVRKIASVVEISEVMDVPLQWHTDPEYFSLTKEQKKAIEEAYDPLPIVRYTHQHEIENGVLYGDEYREDQYFPSDKEERLVSLCQEHDKVAIVCRYNKQIIALYGTLMGKVKDRPVLIINGNVKDRDSVTLAAEQSKKCIVLIQADCAEGYQLPSFGLCVFASMSYAYTKYEQICGRFLRMDKPSRTTFVYLLTEGDSIDQAVFDSIRAKKHFSIELFVKKKGERA